MEPCRTHPWNPASSHCTRCGHPYCDQCLAPLLEEPYCEDCRELVLAEMEEAGQRLKRFGEISERLWLGCGLAFCFSYITAAVGLGVLGIVLVVLFLLLFVAALVAQITLWTWRWNGRKR
jgi:hypothetical protein